MAASKHLGIRDAVAALFTGLAGGRITENEESSLPTDLASQINVRRVRSTPTQPTTSHPVDWETELEVEIVARSETVADDLACSVFALVMANQALGGLAEYVEPGDFEWDQAQAETTVHRVTWRMRVTHTTQNNAIT